MTQGLYFQWISDDGREILREAVNQSIEIVEDGGRSINALNYTKLGDILAQQGITLTLELSHQKETEALTYDAAWRKWNTCPEVTHES